MGTLGPLHVVQWWNGHHKDPATRTRLNLELFEDIVYKTVCSCDGQGHAKVCWIAVKVLLFLSDLTMKDLKGLFCFYFPLCYKAFACLFFLLVSTMNAHQPAARFVVFTPFYPSVIPTLVWGMYFPFTLQYSNLFCSYGFGCQ